MNFTEQFPVLNDYLYLDTAGSGILSQSIQQWRKAHDEQFVKEGSKFRLYQADFLQDVKDHVARFFQAKVENTFLVQNFSIAFNTFLDGLDRSHRFLLLQSDYPSVNYPIESRNFKHIEYAELDENLEQNLLNKVRSSKPTILALSLIQYISGIKIDLNFIKKLKQEYPEMLIVADGTQFCGTESFNFEDSGLDVLLSSGYKWMLSGYGNGFLFIKDHVNEHLYHDRIDHALPQEPFLKHKKLLTLCFEPGHLDTLAFGSLKQSIQHLEQLGMDIIEKRLQTLSELAKKAFTERGLLTSEVAQRTIHSTIFNLRSDEVLTKKMQDANVLFSPRGAGLRVSFHFYNTEQDLEKLLQIIDRT